MSAQVVHHAVERTEIPADILNEMSQRYKQIEQMGYVSMVISGNAQWDNSRLPDVVTNIVKDGDKVD